MNNVRKYGSEPLNVVAVHGGPGAAGEMASLAKEISFYHGVLEPLQTALTVNDQIQELKSIIEEYGRKPNILIGFSWGAWLIFILAAQYPDLVKKLILVGSGPFEAKYAQNIMKVRLNRLDKQEKTEARELLKELNSSTTVNNITLKKFGELVAKTDYFNPLQGERENIVFQRNIYRSIWPEASELRRSGKLLQLGEKIKCPVVAIHGDYDPHPAEGVRKPLSKVLKDFKFILLENCGHKPWIEQTSKRKFYEIVKNQLEIF